MVEGFTDLRRKGMEIVQGPLVHGPEGGNGPMSFAGGGGSCFFYFLDPDGNRLELFSDMMKVSAGERFPRAEYADVCRAYARRIFQNTGPAACSLPCRLLRQAEGIWNCPRVTVGTDA